LCATQLPSAFEPIATHDLNRDKLIYLKLFDLERKNSMSEERSGGDNITVGDIINAQATAIGRNASAQVTGNNISGDVKIDARALRTALESLYDALDQGGLPRDKTRGAQTAAGNALGAVTEKEVKSDIVVKNVKKIGETIKQANVAIQEGTSLWQSVQKLAPLLGPLVGGARIVAGWFGLPL
jgi:hypothetical protein